MTKKQKRHHDNFFRTVFSDPKNAASLLTLASKNNTHLAELLTLVNLDTLQEIPGTAPREGFSGQSDITFQVELNNSNQKAHLIVGLILEHKSYRDSNVRKQLLKYFFEVMQQKIGDIPVVAIIVYNGREKWNPLNAKPYPKYPEFFQNVGLPFHLEFIDVGHSELDLSSLDPQLALVLVAMRYAFDSFGQQEAFKEALASLLKQGNSYSSVLEEILVYLRETLPQQEKETIMDSLEVLENKGYTSIAEAEREEWFLEGLLEGEAKGKAEGFLDGEIKGINDAKREMAKAMLMEGIPIDKIRIISGLSEEEIKDL
jgi:predicted transposase YdaD